MILGPRSSGKTALIQQLFAAAPASSLGEPKDDSSFLASLGRRLFARFASSTQMEEASSAELSTLFGSYVDGREQQLTGSADLASSLQAQGRGHFQRFTDAAKLGGLGVAEATVETLKLSLQPIIQRVFEQEGKQPPLTKVIAGYTAMLKQFSSWRAKKSSASRMPWPVFCIDEANVLTEWAGDSESEQEDRRSLLRFFVRVSLQL